jgi:hypothetical protein
LRKYELAGISLQLSTGRSNRLDLSPSELRTTLRVVDDVTRPDAGIETLARFVVQAGRPLVQAG